MLIKSEDDAVEVFQIPNGDLTYDGLDFGIERRHQGALLRWRITADGVVVYGWLEHWLGTLPAALVAKAADGRTSLGFHPSFFSAMEAIVDRFTYEEG